MFLSSVFATLGLIFDPVSVELVSTIRAGGDPFAVSVPSDAIGMRLEELMSAGVLSRVGSSYVISADGAAAAVSELRDALMSGTS